MPGVNFPMLNAAILQVRLFLTLRAFDSGKFYCLDWRFRRHI